MEFCPQACPCTGKTLFNVSVPVVRGVLEIGLMSLDALILNAPGGDTLSFEINAPSVSANTHIQNSRNSYSLRSGLGFTHQHLRDFRLNKPTIKVLSFG
jgi:hypothetical protein